MKTVRDACQLQPNALAIKLSDQIEQLDELITAEGNGAAFFEKTHITQGMLDLISEGVARLAGASSQAVFHLKQAMGGGKTHLLVGFGLLARHPDLRKAYCAGTPHASAFDSTRIAAFNGRNNPDHFFWGEIANQLGKGEQFRAFWTGGPKAPDEKDWLKLFDGGEPVLILLDEMPPYFHYLDTQKVGGGTVADIATRAFANLLTAAGKKSNVCVVVSDLAAAYDTGAKLINRALEDARAELGRQERNITPVDLAANEIYDILRKRLFKSLPDKAEIEDIADAFGRKLEEAAKAKTANRGAEAIADEVAATYPFHPRLKNVIALFKENEQFKQTRGLIELVSRLLRSVWDRQANDVFLIGPQHFDLSIPEVRDKLTEISGMRDVIAKDLWDGQQSAHAQIIDLQTGKEAATQLGALLLTASLSTAVNAVKGLTSEEMVECLISPLREPSDFLAAFEELEKVAWYLHHTPEGRYYFDRQENLTKLLQSLAHDAPDNQVDDLIRHRLREMFKPSRKTCYDDVLPLPRLDDVAGRIRKGRVLLVVSPDSKIPPEEVQRFFDGLSQKNNLCVLTGEKTAMGSVEKAARQFYAAQKADGRIPKGHAQRDDLERKQQSYEQDFNATILNLFDKVLFPIHRAGKTAQLASKPLDMTRDAARPFNGEEQIEKTLTSNPLKLYLDVEREFDAVRDKAQDLLWPENQDEARWSDVADRYAEQAGMPWLPPKGLDILKSVACNRGLWEDLGNGYLTKRPKKKRTSAQVIRESEPDDDGRVRLRVNPQNAGPAPRIHYAEDAPVTDASAQLKENPYTTAALRVNFLVCDPSGQYETGDPVPWENKLMLRTHLRETDGKRLVALFVAPRGTIRYTLDGSEPREGTVYEGPLAIGDGEVLVRVFAEADGLDDKKDFRFPAVGKKSRERLSKEQQELLHRVQTQVDALGVETDGAGWRAKVYLYCVEARCPQTGWLVPLLPTRIISKGQGTLVDLVPDAISRRYALHVRTGASDAELRAAERGTVGREGKYGEAFLIHHVDGVPYKTKISTLRGDYEKPDGTVGNRLRLWGKHDFTHQPDDLLGERLYCIQWMRPKKAGKGYEYEFRSVNEDDLRRDGIVREHVALHLAEWQASGWIPDMRIEVGGPPRYQGLDLVRARGWTHWHHLFNARQLLIGALVNQSTGALLKSSLTQVLNLNSRLSRFDNSEGGAAATKGAFDNQALNTLFNYGCRGTQFLASALRQSYPSFPLPHPERCSVMNLPAADLTQSCDGFVTDPPYGDAVKYEEILDFFIAWLRKSPPPEFADWIWDSRRSLAIKGEDEDFRRNMVAAYSRMTEHMPDNGIQVIMFTHQSGSLWADMSNIVWASGLQATAAWYVATETDSALREGSHVKGTILLICRKRRGSEKTTRDDLAWEIQEEVQEQVDALTGLNQEAKGLYRDENVFEDADIQMAGYAAALRVLTRYAVIDGRDMGSEAIRPRVKGETTFVDGLINFAVDTANQCLVPQGVPKSHWDDLSGAERFYLKMLDMEARGVRALDNYQNFAKAFKVRDFRVLMGDQRANNARLKSAVEFGRSEMSEGSELYQSVLRAVLYALMELAKNVDGNDVLAHLTLNVPNYYGDMTQRELVVELADYLAKRLDGLRPEEASAARVLRELVKNQRLG